MMFFRKMLMVIVLSTLGMLFSMNNSWASNYNDNTSMEELLDTNSKPIYGHKVRLLIEKKLNSKFPCKYYSNFLNYNKIELEK